MTFNIVQTNKSICAFNSTFDNVSRSSYLFEENVIICLTSTKNSWSIKIYVNTSSSVHAYINPRLDRSGRIPPEEGQGQDRGQFQR